MSRFRPAGFRNGRTAWRRASRPDSGRPARRRSTAFRDGWTAWRRRASRNRCASERGLAMGGERPGLRTTVLLIPRSSPRQTTKSFGASKRASETRMCEPAMTALSPSEYNAILRSDLGFFAQRCFSELNPQAAFAPNWHLEIIAAKLTAVPEGKIRAPDHQPGAAPFEILDGLHRVPSV